MGEPQDVGDFLEVPEDQRLEEDDLVPEEVNADEFNQLHDVPEGEYVELDTAYLDDELDEEEV